jgi:hypothetical protein
MAKLGFQFVDCGEDGPRAWAIAESWNKKWKHALAEYEAGKSLPAPGKIERIYPPDSLGEAFARLCVGKDPSLSVKRKTPQKRDAIWLYDEAERLVKRAIRMELYGLAAALATCWDTQFSPVDVRR